MIETLPGAGVAGCGSYKSTSAEQSMHGGSSSSSSQALQLLDQRQRQHAVCNAGATSSGASMLPSFGFTQEQVLNYLPSSLTEFAQSLSLSSQLSL